MRTLRITLLLLAVFCFSESQYGALTVEAGEPSGVPTPVFSTQNITAIDLQKRFNEAAATKQKIKVLIVPGHEPSVGGAEFKNLKERDIAVDLAHELGRYLSNDRHYEVQYARNKEKWDPVLQKYFDEHDEDIRAFIAAKKDEMARLVNSGIVIAKTDGVPHNSAPEDAAIRLFGINKWANENNIDITLHIHLNDSHPRLAHRAGEYSGFSIYVPEKQYSNAEATKAIASKIFDRLAAFFAISDLPTEDQGVVEDQDLIAVGSNNTMNGASMLIEYGYIYEPQFRAHSVRKVVLKELAFQTYLGLQDFFEGKPSRAQGHKTTLLPHSWERTLKRSSAPNKDTLALQAALSLKGFYPPSGESKNNCPLSGIFGNCTRTALSIFQKKFNISGDGSIVGPKTRAKLNELYN